MSKQSGLQRGKITLSNHSVQHWGFQSNHRHCSFPPIGGFPPISRGFLTPLRLVQICGVNGPVFRGVGGIELAKTKQNRLKMAWFSPEIFLIEQSLNQHPVDFHMNTLFQQMASNKSVFITSIICVLLQFSVTNKKIQIVTTCTVILYEVPKISVIQSDTRALPRIDYGAPMCQHFQPASGWL